MKLLPVPFLSICTYIRHTATDGSNPAAVFAAATVAAVAGAAAPPPAPPWLQLAGWHAPRLLAARRRSVRARPRGMLPRQSRLPPPPPAGSLPPEAADDEPRQSQS
eukprot:NODE_25391_length_589_cov_2.186147.p3 GENE.NODE_25391_length_589_cov_2.186147~~NODE_25391_length_589_cov_2.186147.p3  ORF type:complete len:106 (+),score=27.76 NODE_25391_length_589_cov_2.186147:252-569(+)